MYSLAWALLVASFVRAKHSTLEDNLPFPSRTLEWGDVNFIHTTDIHEHMRAKADAQGVDLLLVDSGDHHDGGGLVSISPESADTSDYYISTLGYDALAIGNHELYKAIDGEFVHKSVKHGRWKGRYLTSNVNITQADGMSVPLGTRIAKFKTKHPSKCQSPLEMIKEQWFLEAIEERPDFFLIPGHMSVRDISSDWEEVIHVIRLRHPHTPVFVFGGHNHIRDCKKPDAHSIIMASGRYMETVGWVSANLTKSGKMESSRRYLDSNRRTFKYHTGTLKGKSFDTDMGLALSNELHEAHRNLNLSVVLGHSPKNYFLSRYPATSDHSVLKKLMDDVLPATVYNSKAEVEHFRLFVANSGSQRFDVFKGPFTVDDQFITSPFVSRFVHFNVTAKVGRKLVWKMNDEGATQLLPSDDSQRSYLSWVEDQSLRHQHASEGAAQAAFNSKKGIEKSEYGYVTVDSCGDRGDDIDHVPFPSRGQIPDYVGSTFPLDKPDDETVTVVVMDFFLNDVVNAVNKLDPSVELDYSSFKPYGNPKVQITDVWGIYAKEFW
ncbi:hypothetical protein QFC21_001229 [Naganishia friedmannii]|uniref:Uncharacterized protein n=1 Tax=Naganishia friedmannii TaxID=89922 RepID=A0ACC2W2X9_9TREE|nr:hypothetical protein QFC21_001229 [Naganishia friedmannii]